MLTHERVPQLLASSHERRLIISEHEHDEVALLGAQILDRRESLNLGRLCLKILLRAASAASSRGSRIRIRLRTACTT
jgi:hypothetical protein